MYIYQVLCDPLYSVAQPLSEPIDAAKISIGAFRWFVKNSGLRAQRLNNIYDTQHTHKHTPTHYYLRLTSNLFSLYITSTRDRGIGTQYNLLGTTSAFSRLNPPSLPLLSLKTYTITTITATGVRKGGTTLEFDPRRVDKKCTSKQASSEQTSNPEPR